MFYWRGGTGDTGGGEAGGGWLAVADVEAWQVRAKVKMVAGGGRGRLGVTWLPTRNLELRLAH
jgi:hypothetical protein